MSDRETPEPSSVEAALLRRVEELERDRDHKDAFLATLAHELRNPLHSIRVWTDLLRRSDPADLDWRKGLVAIDRAASLQERLVDDLDDMVRIDAGKLRLRPQACSAAEVADASIEGVRHYLDARRIVVPRRYERDVPQVWVDPARLQQILGNFLTNAAKASEEGGRVEVWVCRRGDEVAVDVTDYGRGLAGDELPFVFERYYQAAADKGLGLGLSIAKSLAEAQGGRVEAHSEGPGKGATFRVVLPVSE